MYTITLSDGTKLENLNLNGNNYISETLIEDDVFKDNLSTVTISNGEITNTYKDMTLIGNRIYDGKSWFILGEKTVQQKKEEEFSRKLSEMEQVITVLLTGEE